MDKYEILKKMILFTYQSQTHAAKALGLSQSLISKGTSGNQTAFEALKNKYLSVNSASEIFNAMMALVTFCNTQELILLRQITELQAKSMENI